MHAFGKQCQSDSLTFVNRSVEISQYDEGNNSVFAILEKERLNNCGICMVYNLFNLDD